MHIFEDKKNATQLLNMIAHKCPTLGLTQFSLKVQNSWFYPLINACHQVQFWKNLIKDLEKTGILLNLDTQMPHLPNFGHNENFS